MNPASSFFGRLLHISIGYLAAVLAAVFVTLIAMFLPVALRDMGAWALLPGRLGDLAQMVLAGVMITFPSALPGFLIALAVSLVSRWRGWLSFTLAGGLNAPASLVLFNAAIGSHLAMLDPRMTLACVVGGLAGGFAYWRIAGRFTADWRGPAS